MPRKKITSPRASNHSHLKKIDTINKVGEKGFVARNIAMQKSTLGDRCKPEKKIRASLSRSTCK